METNKEIWIDRTLNSAEGIKMVPLSEKLKVRLNSIPSDLVLINSKIPKKAIWLAAASIAILLTMNLVTVKEVRKENQQLETSAYYECFSYLEQV